LFKRPHPFDLKLFNRVDVIQAAYSGNWQKIGGDNRWPYVGFKRIQSSPFATGKPQHASLQPGDSDLDAGKGAA
jgi:hypothetical protein